MIRCIYYVRHVTYYMSQSGTLNSQVAYMFVNYSLKIWS